MTNVKAIIITIGVGIITVIAGLSIIFGEASAGSMDCLNLEVSQAQLSQAKGLKAKVQAKKLVKQWSLLCN